MSTVPGTSPSILYVAPPSGGPPPEFALPRLRAHGDTHVLLFAAPSPALERVLGEWCTSVHVADGDGPMLDAIVAVAREVAADAVVAFSEVAIVAVAAACRALGLRGPGPNVLRSRDKVLMRETWRAAGLPGPAFAPVRSAAELETAGRRLRRPFLLKPSWLAGSIGQVLVTEGADLAGAWREAAGGVEAVARAGLRDGMPAGRGAQFIAEELIDSSTDSWYDEPGYGDYVSVEGLVIGGRYHPVSITGRLPTVPHFVELGFLVPSVLPAGAQRRIEAAARAAVEALGLDTCGTHTELKLQRDGGLCLIESAARLGGAMIPRLVHDALGVDLIDLLVRALLGKEVDLPERMPIPDGSGGAAASLMALAVDSAGRPWTTTPTYRPDLVDWGRLTSPGTTVEVVRSQSPSLGIAVPRYSPGAGGRNSAGPLVLHAREPRALHADCLRVADGLEAALGAVEVPA